MPFNKFDPHAAPQQERSNGERKARLLRWWSLLTLLYTALGFGFIAYWMFW